MNKSIKTQVKEIIQKCECEIARLDDFNEVEEIAGIIFVRDMLKGIKEPKKKKSKKLKLEEVDHIEMMGS